jgi:DNA-binding CsgD family transcriptional regulator
MTDTILTFNAGSSSLKFALFACRGQSIAPVFRGQLEDLDEDPRFLVADAAGRRIVDRDLGELRRGAWTHSEALDHLLRWIDAHDDDLVLRAIGHRVVHGGEQFVAPVIVDDAVIGAIEAGATGYLLKDDSAADIAEAIVALVQGGSPISPGIARHILKRWQSPPAASPDLLTEREADVLERLAKGHTYAETAALLHVSAHTVATHVKHIYRKLAVSSRGAAVFEAYQRGLLRHP